MLYRILSRFALSGLLLGTALLGPGAQKSDAQILPWKKRSSASKACDCPPACAHPSTQVLTPGVITPMVPPTPAPGQTTPPPQTTPPQTTNPTNPITTDPTGLGLGMGGDATGPLDIGTEIASAVGGGRDISASNYIDSAVIRSQVRFRFDAMFDYPLPDRGEFLYPKCGCFRLAGVDPNAAGPPLEETGISSNQEYATYLEYAFGDDLSAFVEIPIRSINPEQNTNETGLSDINFGFKYAFINQQDRVVTFQLRTYTPTGDGGRGLGTEHYSIEPAILFLYQLSDRVLLEGEVRDWIGIRGTDFTGNVLRYGAGLSYLAYNSCNFRIQPVIEVVGWTFLDGQFFVPGNVGGSDADGDTIVNVKAGIRFGFGDLGQGLLSQSDIAISYGNAITNDQLYDDIFRIEIRRRF